MLASQYVRYLPEVGGSLHDRVLKIESFQRERAQALLRADALQEILAREELYLEIEVAKLWTAREIRVARKAAAESL